MIKKIIIAFVGIIIIITAGVLLYNYSQQKVVTFNYKDGQYQINVTTNQNKIIAKVTSSGSQIRLSPGIYYYQVTGDVYANTKHSLVISKKDITISVFEDYSDSKLSSIFSENDTENITNILNGGILKTSGTTLDKLSLLGRGEYAGGVITYQPYPQEPSDSYRFLFKKTGNTWQMIIKPSLAVYKGNYSDISDSVIYKLYNL